MSTTTLLVEILIVGILAAISLYLPLLTFTSFRLDNISNLSVFLQIGVIYTAGIIWNRVCNLVFSLFEKRITNTIFLDKREWFRAKLKVMASGGKLSEYTEVLRSFVRISRAVALLALIHGVTIFIDSSTVTHSGFTKIQVSTFYTLLLSSSLFSWYWHRRGYLLTVKTAQEILPD